MSYYFIPSILLKFVVYIFVSSYYICCCISSIIRQLYAICHINEKTKPQYYELLICVSQRVILKKENNSR